MALDGKRLRGSAPAGHDGSAGVHLVAAFACRLGAVTGPLQVEPDGNETKAAPAVLKGLPLQGSVITGDAEFCRRAICRTIRDGQGEDLFAVEASQPTSMADGAAQVCGIERTRDCAGTISHEIADAITGLSPEQADPDALLALWRDHRLIEDRLHWCRTSSCLRMVLA